MLHRSARLQPPRLSVHCIEGGPWCRVVVVSSLICSNPSDEHSPVGNWVLVAPTEATAVATHDHSSCSCPPAARAVPSTSNIIIPRSKPWKLAAVSSGEARLPHRGQREGYSAANLVSSKPCFISLNNNTHQLPAMALRQSTMQGSVAPPRRCWAAALNAPRRQPIRDAHVPRATNRLEEQLRWVEQGAMRALEARMCAGERFL